MGLCGSTAVPHSPRHSSGPLSFGDSRPANGGQAASPDASRRGKGSPPAPQRRSSTVASSQDGENESTANPSFASWRKGRILGKGTYGTVYLGLDDATGGLMAVKEVEFQRSRQDMVDGLRHEIDILRERGRFRVIVYFAVDRIVSEQDYPWEDPEEWGPHPRLRVRRHNQSRTCACGVNDEYVFFRSLHNRHIVGYMGTKVEGNTLYVFMEWVPGGSIETLLKQFGGRLPSSVVQTYARQILLGLQYLHQSNVVHCDMKPANILVDNESTVKLADFGASRKLRSVKQAQWAFAETVDGDAEEDGQGASPSGGPKLFGTPYFTAPELVRGEECSHASDIWAFGCTILHMATGKPPWSDYRCSTIPQLLNCIVEHPEGPTIPVSLPTGLQSLLSRCFAQDPADRPSAETLLRDPFIEKAKRRVPVTAGSDKRASNPASRGLDMLRRKMSSRMSRALSGGFQSMTSMASARGGDMTRGMSRAFTLHQDTEGQGAGAQSRGDSSVSSRHVPFEAEADGARHKHHNSSGHSGSIPAGDRFAASDHFAAYSGGPNGTVRSDSPSQDEWHPWARRDVVGRLMSESSNRSGDAEAAVGSWHTATAAAPAKAVPALPPNPPGEQGTQSQQPGAAEESSSSSESGDDGHDTDRSSSEDDGDDEDDEEVSHRPQGASEMYSEGRQTPPLHEPAVSGDPSGLSPNPFAQQLAQQRQEHGHEQRHLEEPEQEHSQQQVSREEEEEEPGGGSGAVVDLSRAAAVAASEGERGTLGTPPRSSPVASSSSRSSAFASRAPVATAAPPEPPAAAAVTAVSPESEEAPREARGQPSLGGFDGGPMALRMSTAAPDAQHEEDWGVPSAQQEFSPSFAAQLETLATFARQSSRQVSSLESMGDPHGGDSQSGADRRGSPARREFMAVLGESSGATQPSHPQEAYTGIRGGAERPLGREVASAWTGAGELSLLPVDDDDDEEEEEDEEDNGERPATPKRGLAVDTGVRVGEGAASPPCSSPSEQSVSRPHMGMQHDTPPYADGTNSVRVRMRPIPKTPDSEPEGPVPLSDAEAEERISTFLARRADYHVGHSFGFQVDRDGSLIVYDEVEASDGHRG